MATRPLDLAAAALALLPAAPLCLLAAAGIWLTDGRPVLYASRRVGRGGRTFIMYKFRTMRNGQAPASAATSARAGAHANSTANAGAGGHITAEHDARVFPFGRFLRRWKIDELPQLLNVLRGDMAIVGPRPEDPAIVARYYTPLARETLAVRPGLASPGSIYNFTHGERQLGQIAAAAARRDAAAAGAAAPRPINGYHAAAAARADVDDVYGRGLLPRKLALDLVYVRRASLAYDLRIVGRAAVTIVEHGLGRRTFPEPPEMPRARQLEGALHQPSVSSAELP